MTSEASKETSYAIKKKRNHALTESRAIPQIAETNTKHNLATAVGTSVSFYTRTSNDDAGKKTQGSGEETKGDGCGLRSYGCNGVDACAVGLAEANGDDAMTPVGHVAKSIKLGAEERGSPPESPKRVDPAEKTTEDPTMKTVCESVSN